MSAERMTSRAEADHIKYVIMQAVDELDRAGYTRGQIGAAMTGISVALVAVHDGRERAERVIGMAQAALLRSLEGRDE